MKGSGDRWKYLEIPLILLIATLATLLAQPYGDFPLNDDAYYAPSVFHLARTGELRLTAGTVPSLRSQVVWGALFVRLFGESFEVLRAATMTLAVLTLVILNRMLAMLPIPRSLRIVATLSLLFHPIFFLLSFTFMTDVPFVFVSAVAMYCYFRGIRDESLAFALLGGLATVVSWWIRQTGVLNALTPLVILIVFRHHLAARYRSLIAATALPVAMFAVILFMHPEWLTGSPQEFRLHYKMWGERTFSFEERVKHIFRFSYFNAQNTAFFLMPLAVVIDWRIFRSPAARLVFVAVLVILLCGVGHLLYYGHLLPYSDPDVRVDIRLLGSMVVDFGMGPLSMPDQAAYPFKMPRFTRYILTVVVTLLATAMLAGIVLRLLDYVPDARSHLLFILASMHALIGSLALCVSEHYFDRYTFDAGWSLVLVLPFLIRWEARATRWLSAAILVVVALFSIFATGEYFSWNRARWEAVAYFRSHGGDVTHINAGGEPLIHFEMVRLGSYRERRRFFGEVMVERRYRVGFAHQPGYRLIRVFPFSGWMGLHRANLYLEERISGKERDPS